MRDPLLVAVFLVAAAMTALSIWLRAAPREFGPFSRVLDALAFRPFGLSLPPGRLVIERRADSTTVQVFSPHTMMRSVAVVAFVSAVVLWAIVIFTYRGLASLRIGDGVDVVVLVFFGVLATVFPCFLGWIWARVGPFAKHEVTVRRGSLELSRRFGFRHESDVIDDVAPGDVIVRTAKAASGCLVWVSRENEYGGAPLFVFAMFSRVDAEAIVEAVRVGLVG